MAFALNKIVPYLFESPETGVYLIEVDPVGVKSISMLNYQDSEQEERLRYSDALLEVVQFGDVVWETMQGRSVRVGICDSQRG